MALASLKEGFVAFTANPSSIPHIADKTAWANPQARARPKSRSSLLANWLSRLSIVEREANRPDVN